ncbi:MAG: immunoglobulin-like domain-containing protein [Spirochaetota bacterium]
MNAALGGIHDPIGTNPLHRLCAVALALSLAASFSCTSPAAGVPLSPAEKALAGLTLSDFTFPGLSAGSAFIALSTSFTVPLTKGDYTLAWSSTSEFVSKIDPLSGQVFVNIPEAIPTGLAVKVTVTASPAARALAGRATDTATKEFSLDLKPMTSTTAAVDAVIAGLAAGTLDLSGKDTSGSVSGSFTLPVDGSYGTVVTWESSNTSAVSIDQTTGKATVTTTSTGTDRTVTLTPKVKKKTAAAGSGTPGTPITITIPPLDPATALVKDTEAVPEIVASTAAAALSGGGQTFSLPATSDRGCNFLWSSDSPSIAIAPSSSNGLYLCTVTPGSTDQSVVLTANLSNATDSTKSSEAGVTVKVKAADPTAEVGATGDALYLWFEGTEDKDTITSGFRVGHSGLQKNGSTVAWSAVPSGVLAIAADKTVTATQASAAQAVTLSATVSKTGATNVTRSWTLTIQKSERGLVAGFGTGGKVTVSGDAATLIRNAADGSFYGCSSKMSDPRQPSKMGVIVLKYKLDGSLDSSYGSSGIVTLAPATVSSTLVSLSPKTMALGLEGAVYLGGQARDSGTGSPSFIIKVDSTGSLDASFGSSGVIRGDGMNDISVTAIEVINGALFVLGGASNGNYGLRKYDLSGKLDTTFSGGKGFFALDVTNIPGLNSSPVPLRLVSDSQGKIHIPVSLRSSVSPNPAQAAAFRVSSSGVLDTSWGSSGFFKAGVPAEAPSLLVSQLSALAPDGSFMAALGEKDSSSTNIGFRVYRFPGSGTGVAMGELQGLAFWPTASVCVGTTFYAAGYVQDDTTGSTAAKKALVYAFSTLTGLPDTAFGTKGVFTPFPTAYSSQFTDLCVSGNEVLAIGSSRASATSNTTEICMLKFK